MSSEVSFSSKKAIMRLREACPVFMPLVCFAIGQLLGHFYLFLGVSLVILLGIFTLILPRFRICLCFILSGVLSIISVFPNQVNVDLDASYGAVVLSEPRYKKPGQVELRLRVIHVLTREGKAYSLDRKEFKAECTAIDLPWRNLNKVVPGDYFLFQAKFKPILAELNPFSYSNKLLRAGLSTTCKIKFSTNPQHVESSFLFAVREFIRGMTISALGNNETSGLFLSMSLGIRDVLSRETEEVFKLTGLAHLLVVSGYQISLMFLAAFTLFKNLLIRSDIFFNTGLVRAFSLAFSLLFSLFFLGIVGFDDSANRAFIALFLYSIGSLSELGQKKYQLLAASAFIMLLLWPGCWLEPSFQLTYAALCGIYLGTNGCRYFNFSSFLKANLYASLFSMLVAGVWFSRISLLGIFLNPIFSTIVSCVSCKLGFLALLLYIVKIDQGAFFLKAIARFLCLFRDLIVEIAARFDSSFDLGGFISVSLLILTIFIGTFFSL
ncbi:MAG: ComEC/Rec2 family competence protein, partial [Bdellovibrionales bacterium]|nr:ComEC/Rec2 family competence protein [Bdellovibrionales bacterium]